MARKTFDEDLAALCQRVGDLEKKVAWLAEEAATARLSTPAGMLDHMASQDDDLGIFVRKITGRNDHDA